MKTNKDNCPGCKINDRCITPPTKEIDGGIQNCPCKICLIKCICENHCDDFKNYARNLKQDIKNDKETYVIDFSRRIHPYYVHKDENES